MESWYPVGSRSASLIITLPNIIGSSVAGCWFNTEDSKITNFQQPLMSTIYL